MAVSLAGISGALMSPPTGWFAGRYGIKRVLLIGTSLLAAGAILLGLARGWEAAIPGLLVSITAMTITMCVCPMVCGSSLESWERGTGMQMCDTLSALPRLAAAAIAAYAITVFGGLSADNIRPLYFLQGAGYLALLLLISRKFTNPRRMALHRQESGFLKEVHSVFKEGRRIKTVLVFAAIFQIPVYAHPIYWPLFVQRVKGADQSTIGIMAILMWILPLLFALPLGRFADTIGRKRAVYFTLAVFCSSLLLMIHAQNTVELFISAILQGALPLMVVTIGTMALELVPTRLIPSWVSLRNMFRGIVTLIFAPLLLGVIWDNIGPSSVFWFMILVDLFVALPLLITMPETLERHRRERAETSAPPDSGESRSDGATDA